MLIMERAYPTKTTILDACKEYRHLGTDAFLEKYTNGNRSRTIFLKFDGDLYPLKAVYCAAHEPPIVHRLVNSTRAATVLIATEN